MRRYNFKTEEEYLAHRKKTNEATRSWIKANPEKYRSIYLQKRYGISAEEYQQLLQQQNGLCVICSNAPFGKKRLSVDHCHKTNKVRGLLCPVCNRFLGFVKDDIALVERYAKYLKGELNGTTVRTTV